MREQPVIATAIPKRRYLVGEFSASLLGEIESRDGRDYRFILAFVQMGHTEPLLYMCAEPTPTHRRSDGRYHLRLVSEAMSEVVDTSDRWGDIEAFAEQGLKVGAQVLGLQREQVVRLL